MNGEPQQSAQDNLQAQLIRDEGEILHAYQDSLGYWTIGVGHLIDARKSGSIPPAISRELLVLDIATKTATLSETFPWTDALDEVRLGVLQNMTFQMGVRGLAEFQNMLNELQAGNFAAAAQEGLDSDWARTQSPARAARLMIQMETGEWQ